MVGDGLLEYVGLRAAARYISDLRFMPYACLLALECVPADMFTAAEWDDAGEYLCGEEGYRPQGSCDAARDEVLRLLRAKAAAAAPLKD